MWRSDDREGKSRSGYARTASTSSTSTGLRASLAKTSLENLAMPRLLHRRGQHHEPQRRSWLVAVPLNDDLMLPVGGEHDVLEIEHESDAEPTPCRALVADLI